jgi:hypothetical protein
VKRDRIVITGVHLPFAENAPSLGDRPPVALGMVMAYARKMLGADPMFDLEPRFVTTTAEAERITSQPGRHVLLYSDYVWSYDRNIELSARIKASRPDVINIHGGANIPSYPKACEAWLRSHEHADFVVKGEGETALVDLLSAIASGDAKKKEVPSVSMLMDGRFVQHPVRERTRDLDEFPSPYLTGVFDSLAPDTWASATIETNRGCPYGCTFCDWGAATLQKIRTFSLDRIRAELTWLAEHKVPAMWIADANFGILPRDVDVARIIVEVKKKYGWPKRLTTNYAKNTQQHLIDIIELFLDAQLISTGIISIQTRDDRTLEIVRRKNIKTREYDKLRAEFQRRGLPLAVQLMIGLPGATLQAMEDDLSFYFDTPMEVQIFRTVMLPNSPMAEPDYRAAHGIEAREDGLVKATSTMKESDFEIATLVARAFNAAHHYGVIRYPLVLLRREHGLDPLATLHALAVEEPELQKRLPLLAGVLDVKGYLFDLTTSHREFLEGCRVDKSWEKLGEELMTWLGERYGIVRDSGWDAILAAQAAVMPTAGRAYPYTVDLPHDVVRWYEDGRTGTAKPLKSYPPLRFVVEDPLDFGPREYTARRATRLHWELASPLAHARAGDLGGAKVNPTIEISHPGVGLSWAVVSAAAPE